jgi:hypothetical protein
MPKESTTTNLPSSYLSYEMKLARGPSEPGNCSPSGWPTAEFISVLAEKSVSNFREHLPIFLFVVWVNNLDTAQGGRGWLENASPSEMAVEESPLGPRRTRPDRS